MAAAPNRQLKHKFDYIHRRTVQPNRCEIELCKTENMSSVLRWLGDGFCFLFIVVEKLRLILFNWETSSCGHTAAFDL